jgi:hypothetical protein
VAGVGGDLVELVLEKGHSLRVEISKFEPLLAIFVNAED